jgi:ubiquinone/menaquinone biosynthesis C-methylase UbiE
MDGYTIAFGIRNVTHIEKALAEAYRYLTCKLEYVPVKEHGMRRICSITSLLKNRKEGAGII